MLLTWAKEIEVGWLWWKKALPHFLTGQIVLCPKRTRLRALVDPFFLPASSTLACMRVALSFDPPQYRELIFQLHFHSQLPSGGFCIKKINLYMYICLCVCKIMPVKKHSDSLISLVLFYSAHMAQSKCQSCLECLCSSQELSEPHDTGRWLGRIFSNTMSLKCSQESTLPKQQRYPHRAQARVSNPYTAIFQF